MSFIEKLNRFPPQSPPALALLNAGYPDLTPERAEAIIRERAKNPATYSLDEVRQAEAFLAAWRATPQVVSTRPAWRVRKEA